VRGKIDAEFVDLGERALKNMARPVRVYGLKIDTDIAAQEAAVSERQGPSRFSMVVLPFTNLSGAAGQEHFVDGVTDSLTTDLSRIRGAFVIGRNTAFTYKGKAVDLRQIGRELSVRYVLEGSVQCGGNRLRVNVQLIDAETGNHLGAERFDKPIADLFDMQDEIVARLASALSPQLIEAEARRAEKATNPDSMDLYFQGLAWLNRGITPHNVTQARNLLDRARSIAPDNVEALVASARVDVVAAGSLFVSDPIAAFQVAEAKLNKALSTVPDHAASHTLLGALYIHTKRVVRGIAECEHALALNRNLAIAYAFIGLGKTFIGRAEEAEAHVVDALRLSPRDTHSYLWMSFAGHAKSLLGLHDEALAWHLRSIEANRNYARANFYLAACLAYLGRQEQARSAVKAGLAIDPSFTVSRTRAGLTTMFDDSNYSTWIAGALEGLRMAGVPEQ
jgi:TolB-like protein